MNQRRIKRANVFMALFTSILILRLFLVANPIYNFLEPVLAPLEKISSSIQNVQTTDGDLEVADDDTIKITRKNFNTYSKTVWVNTGKTEGVVVGDTVTANNALFGRVIEVFDDVSVVSTVLDPEFRATAQVGNAHGVLINEYGSLILDLVPRTSEDTQNRNVITDGLDGLTAVDIPIGLIGDEASNSDDVFAAYAVELPYNPYDVQFVKVLTSEAAQ